MATTITRDTWHDGPDLGVDIYEDLERRAAHRLATAERREAWVPHAVRAVLALAALVTLVSALQTLAHGRPSIPTALGIAVGVSTASATATWLFLRWRGPGAVEIARMTHRVFSRLLARARADER